MNRGDLLDARKAAEATGERGEEFVNAYLRAERNGGRVDSFEWSPQVEYFQGDAEHAKKVWDAAKDFSGPVQTPVPLTLWQEYAQVLLLSNEMFFVD